MVTLDFFSIVHHNHANTPAWWNQGSNSCKISNATRRSLNLPLKWGLIQHPAHMVEKTQTQISAARLNGFIGMSWLVRDSVIYVQNRYTCHAFVGDTTQRRVCLKKVLGFMEDTVSHFSFLMNQTLPFLTFTWKLVRYSRQSVGARSSRTWFACHSLTSMHTSKFFSKCAELVG